MRNVWNIFTSEQSEKLEFNMYELAKIYIRVKW